MLPRTIRTCRKIIGKSSSSQSGDQDNTLTTEVEVFGAYADKFSDRFFNGFRISAPFSGLRYVLLWAVGNFAVLVTMLELLQVASSAGSNKPQNIWEFSKVEQDREPMCSFQNPTVREC